jgi:hypothetical protein
MYCLLCSRLLASQLCQFWREIFIFHVLLMTSSLTQQQTVTNVLGHVTDSILSLFKISLFIKHLLGRDFCRHNACFWEQLYKRHKKMYITNTIQQYIQVMPQKNTCYSHGQVYILTYWILSAKFLVIRTLTAIRT